MNVQGQGKLLREGSDVTLVLLRALGEGTLYKTPRAALCKMLEEI